MLSSAALDASAIVKSFNTWDWVSGTVENEATGTSEGGKGETSLLVFRRLGLGVGVGERPGELVADVNGEGTT